MASCSALWGTPLCHLFVPTHPSTIYMTRVLTSFRLLCKYYLTFALKHFTYTSYPRSSIIFSTLCTAYHLAYYLPCFCVPDRAKSLRGRGFPLILFSPVFLMLRTTCCMAILTEQDVKEWMCAEMCARSLGSQRAVLSQFWGEVWQRLYFWEYFDFQ